MSDRKFWVHFGIVTICVALLQACDQPSAPVETGAAPETTVELTAQGPADSVNAIADRYYASVLELIPETAYFSGLELERHDGMQDNSAAGRQQIEAITDELLAEIQAINANELVGQTEWITHAYLLEALEASVAQRVCRTELWNVSQMGGWHSAYTTIAMLQPVGTDEARQQSLARWNQFPAFIDQEIANLEEGLVLGYSAPKPVVQRVVDQVDGLLALEIEASPFYSPAARDEDPGFASATRALVSEQIYPALQRYRDYLAGPYMDQARSELSITYNPNGLDCYAASLRAYTTLDRSGEEVYELGEKTVAANKAQVIELGEKAYGLDDFVAIIERAKADPADRFASQEELLEFSRNMVLRAEKEMPNWVGKMPEQPVEVVPFPEHEEGTGRSAHYRPAGPDRPGEYRIPLDKPEDQSRGNAEATAFHETCPGTTCKWR